MVLTTKSDSDIIFSNSLTNSGDNKFITASVKLLSILTVPFFGNVILPSEPEDTLTFQVLKLILK